MFYCYTLWDVLYLKQVIGNFILWNNTDFFNLECLLSDTLRKIMSFLGILFEEMYWIKINSLQVESHFKFHTINYCDSKNTFSLQIINTFLIYDVLIQYVFIDMTCYLFCVYNWNTTCVLPSKEKTNALFLYNMSGIHSHRSIFSDL